MTDYMTVFFQDYIKDVLGALPEERQTALQNLNLPQVLKSKATTWQGAIQDSLALSDTINVAILDLWYRNRKAFEDEAGIPDADWFAEIFAQKYLEENSQVDVWTVETLRAAKERIKTIQAAETKP